MYSLEKQVIPQEYQDELVLNIDNEAWNNVDGRRIQIYGCSHKDIPEFFDLIIKELYPDCNQIIINEYFQGESVCKYINEVKKGERVKTLLLISSIDMDIWDDCSTCEEINVRNGDILTMNCFPYAIVKRNNDTTNKKNRRISITMRRVY